MQPHSYEMCVCVFAQTISHYKNSLMHIRLMEIYFNPFKYFNSFYFQEVFFVPFSMDSTPYQIIPSIQLNMVLAFAFSSFICNAQKNHVFKIRLMIENCGTLYEKKKKNSNIKFVII